MALEHQVRQQRCLGIVGYTIDFFAALTAPAVGGGEVSSGPLNPLKPFSGSAQAVFNFNFVRAVVRVHPDPTP